MEEQRTLTSKKLKLLRTIDDKVDWNEEMLKLRDSDSSSGPNLLMSHTTRLPDEPNKLSKAQKRRKAKKNNKQSSSSLLSKVAPGVLITSSDSSTVPTVVFDNPDVRWKRGSKGRSLEGELDDSTGIDVDLKKARYEIMKFGINGLSGAEKVDAETGLAISLGAVPEKRSSMNYKLLLEKRKEDREAMRLQKAASVKPKLKASANKKSKTAKRAKKELSGNNIIVKSKLSDGQKKANVFGKKKGFPGKRPDKRTRMNKK